jgi:hypothetical protein
MICDGCGKEQIEDGNESFATWRQFSLLLKGIPFRGVFVKNSDHASGMLHACSPACVRTATRKALEETLVSFDREIAAHEADRARA